MSIWLNKILCPKRQVENNIKFAFIKSYIILIYYELEKITNTLIIKCKSNFQFLKNIFYFLEFEF